MKNASSLYNVWDNFYRDANKKPKMGEKISKNWPIYLHTQIWNTLYNTVSKFEMPSELDISKSEIPFP